jgi:hypothetical protein
MQRQPDEPVGGGLPMRGKLRELWTIDGNDPREFDPVSPTEFGLNVRAMIGSDSGPGEESFDMLVRSRPG